jgi:RNA polymerase sigma-70 factor (ECF subfamily)
MAEFHGIICAGEAFFLRRRNLGETVGEEFGDQLVTLLPRLRRFARGLTGSAEEGDDLVQAACERALERVAQFQQGSRLDSWMYRIVRTVWIDRIRHKSRLEQGVDPADLARYAGGEGDRLAEDRIALAEARRAIAKLAPNLREVLALVSIEGLGYREAAEVIGVPLGTVMSRLSRARLALAEAMAERKPKIGNLPKRGT